MAQSRRASRRNATVNGDASSEVAEPESAGVVENGGRVEEDGDATVEENEISAVRSKEQTTLGVEADAAEMEVDPEKLKAEEALWEAFKEEFHEGSPNVLNSTYLSTQSCYVVYEQLPLYLHRQFTLMRELDEQTSRE